MNDCFLTFVTMYFALDSLNEKRASDALEHCLSDLNPFVWGDIGSADRSYYEEFSDKFETAFSRCIPSAENSLFFVKSYVSKLSEEFCAIYPEDYDFCKSFEATFDSENWSELWKHTYEKLMKKG